MDKQFKLERLWYNYCKNPDMEPEAWLPFLHFLCIKPPSELPGISCEAVNDIFTLGKTKNLLIFLIKGEYKVNSIVKVCVGTIAQLDLLRTEYKQILVLHPSLKGISLFYFDSNSEVSFSSLKIIHLPRGRIPIYFQELIRRSNKVSLELLQEMFDVPALEADFLKFMKEKITTSNVELRVQLILYISLLLFFSELSLIDNFLDCLKCDIYNLKQISLQECFRKLKEFDSQQVVINEEISIIEVLFNKFGLSTFSLDMKMIQDLQERYIFSLTEPTGFIQEVAINPSVLSDVTENVFISSSKKKKEGKYYTSIAHADFISYLAVYRLLANKLPGISSDNLFKWVYQDWGLGKEEPKVIDLTQLSNQSLSRVLDPACGTGTFLLSVSRLLTRLASSGSIATNRNFPIVEIVAIDSDEIAVLITKIRLIFFRIHEFSNFSFKSSVKGKKFPIRWDINNIMEGDFFNHKEIYEKKYDLILGNPPWVRHEDIGIGQAPEYKDLIQSQIKDLSGNSIHFDRKSDLYIYFCLMGLSLLEKGGVLAFLTSNAWLEVNYGRTLQMFLLDPNQHIINFDIIHRSGKRLWQHLGINSIILIAEKTSYEAKLSSGTFTQSQVNFPQIPLSSLKKGLISRNTYEDDFYRTEQIPKELLKRTHKWAGTFLRMSHSERKIIQDFGKKGVPLANLADVRFGIKTGANDFFHLQRLEKKRTDGKVYVRNRSGFEGLIEEKYLEPLIKSPNHIKGFIIPPSFIPQLWLFYCHDSPTQLQGSKAWTYIKWGENTTITIKQGKKVGEKTLGFSSVRSVEQRDYWYSIGRYPTPSLLWTKSYHDKSGCFYNQAGLMPDQRFYGILVKQPEILPLIFTYLNSSLVWAQMEAQGITNMGFGVLDTNVYWLREVRIPVEAIAEENHIKKLMNQLILEENRASMLRYSKVRTEIDQFYAKYLELSEKSMKRLYRFNTRSITNRLQ
ncbi:MAG: N-6 DNA methylase [Candidatus Heimdallarchaeota archaeon]|nr:MAG: N-6 DNA methylase [Candidatus Heimdallarchaeota archaeon]